MSLKNNKPLVLAYITLALLGGLTLILNKFSETSPWLVFLSFYVLLMVPGFSLNRLLKIEFDDRFDSKIVYLTLGFIFAMLFAFLSMFFGFDINLLLTLYLSLTAVLFLTAFILDLFSKHEPRDLRLDIKNILKLENLPILLLCIFTAIVLINIDFRGANFQGDPFFHLAIMRKAIEGQPLTPENLAYVKGNLDIAYGFPVWHVFLSMLAKFLSIDIFALWNAIILPLSAFSIAVWYWLSKKIFSFKYLAAIATALFIIFNYDSTGYIFTRLAVPDTFGQLILLPLTVGLALEYIFNPKNNYKFLLVLSVLVILMAAIHFTQYFYYLLIMGVFTLTYLATQFRSKEYKSTLFRIISAGFANLALILPFLALFEIKSKTVSETLEGFMNAKNPELRYDIFEKFTLQSKIGYLSAPLVLLFIKKYKPYIFLFALFLVTPLAYSKTIWFLKYWLTKIIGYIFMKRLYGNVTWSWLVWAAIIGFVLVLADRLLSKIKVISRTLKIVIDLAVALSFVILLWADGKYKIFTELNKKIFSIETDSLINKNYLIILIAVICFTIVFLILQTRNKKIREIFTFSKIENPLVFCLMTLIIMLIILGQNGGNLWSVAQKAPKNSNFFSKVRDPKAKVVDIKNLGGSETVDFIRNKIPPKSVFDSNSGYFLIPLVSDQFMSAYHSDAATEFEEIYKCNEETYTRVRNLELGKIEYVLIIRDQEKITPCFDRYPNYFTLTYKNSKATIYAVNREKVSKAWSTYHEMINKGMENLPEL